MPNISLAAGKVFYIFSFPITNSFIGGIIVSLILIVLAVLASRKQDRIPGRFQAAVEMVLGFILNLGEQIVGDRSLIRKFFPLIATIFIFIIANNWFGILPGVGSIGKFVMHEGRKILIPFLRSANADLNTTLALAVIGVVSTHVVGIHCLGVKEHVCKFVNCKSVIHFFIGILEMFSEFFKVISFSFRLFGNIFAGEVLLLVVSALVPVVAALPFYFLEIFVGFIQALVFTTLILVFIKICSSAH